MTDEKNDSRIANTKLLSVVLAVRNEEKYIDTCIRSLIQQDLEPTQYEILIIDGDSQDNTKNIIYNYRDQYPNLIRVFDNPKRTAPNGRNIGIMESKSEWVFIFSGHCSAHPKLLSSLISASQKIDSNIAGIGAIHISPQDDTFLGQVMHEVQSTALGGLGTSFKNSGKTAYIESAAFTMYRKKVLLEIGLHDPYFIIGQDMDLNYRVRRKGYRLMLSPESIVYYYRRHSTIIKMMDRMTKYGKWKSIFFKVHPKAFRLIYVIPSLLVLSIIGLPVFSMVNPSISWLISISLAIYFIMVIINSILISHKYRSFRYMISILIYMVEHIGFGIGFLWGIFSKNGFKRSLSQRMTN